MDIIPQSCLREWPEFPVAVHYTTRVIVNFLYVVADNVSKILSAATLLTIFEEGISVMFFRRAREEYAKLKKERAEIKEERRELEELKEELDKATIDSEKANENRQRKSE